MILLSAAPDCNDVIPDNVCGSHPKGLLFDLPSRAKPEDLSRTCHSGLSRKICLGAVIPSEAEGSVN